MREPVLTTASAGPLRGMSQKARGVSAAVSMVMRLCGITRAVVAMTRTLWTYATAVTCIAVTAAIGKIYQSSQECAGL